MALPTPRTSAEAEAAPAWHGGWGACAQLQQEQLEKEYTEAKKKLMQKHATDLANQITVTPRTTHTPEFI